MEITVPEDWNNLAQALVTATGTVFILGATDTGKSTLTRFLARNLVLSGRTVALVDADIGQSSLGLPGTVSCAVFRSRDDVNGFRCERFSFIGSVSPLPVMSFLIKETCRYVSLGGTSAEITLIDTTGLVTEEPGRRLKTEKIRAVRPDLIVAVERDTELEHILELTRDIDVVRLKPSPHARTRRIEARSRYRAEKLAGYFRSAGEILLNTHSLEFFFQGRPIAHGDPRIQVGTVVGLSHDADTDGLGIVTEFDTNSLLLKTPLNSLKRIKRVMFGVVA